MALRCRVISTTCPTSTGTVSYTDPALGLQSSMRAVKVEVVKATALDTDTDGLSACMGLSDGTTQAVVAWSSEHNVGTTNTHTYTNDDAVVALMDPADGSLLAEAVFSSWVANGVQLNWTTAPASAYRLKITLWSGSDVSADLQVVTPSSTIGGTITVTPSYSAETHLVLGLGGSRASKFDGTLEDGAAYSFGGCSNDGSSVQQNCGNWASTDGVTSTDPTALIHTARIAQHQLSGFLSAQHALLNFNASTGAFDLGTYAASPGTDYRYAVLCFSLPVGAQVFTVSMPTATGTTSWTNPQFRPQYVYLGVSVVNAVNTIKDNAQGGVFSSCEADEDGNEASIAWGEDDAVATSDNFVKFAEAAVDCPLDSGGATGYGAIVSSWDATGFTLNFDRCLTSSTRYGWAFALEEDGEPDAARVIDESVGVDDGTVAWDTPVFRVVGESVGVDDEPVDVPSSIIVDELIGVDDTVVDGVSTVILDENVGVDDTVVDDLGDPPDSIVVVDEPVGVDDEPSAGIGVVVVNEDVDPDDGQVIPQDAVRVVDEQVVVGDLALNDDPTDTVVRVVAERLDLQDDWRLSLRTPVIRRLASPQSSVGSGYVSWSQPRMPVPQAFPGDVGVGPISTRIRIANESFGVLDAAVRAVIQFDESVLAEAVAVDDAIVTYLFDVSSETPVLAEAVSVSDSVVAFVEDPYVPPDEWDPPTNLGFDQSFFDEPMQIDMTVTNRQFASNDYRDKVVEMVNTVAPNEEWRGIQNALRWTIRASQHSRSHFKARDQGFPDHRAFCVKLNSGSSVISPTKGEFDYIHFWDVGFYNEGENDSLNKQGQVTGSAAKFMAGIDQSEPEGLGLTDADNWKTRPDLAPLNVGVLCFHRCEFRVPCGPTEVNCNPTLGWGGFGVKMHLHQQAPHDLLVDDCVFRPAQEHHIYDEWIQRLHVRGCFFGINGGNAIQVASRGGDRQFYNVGGDYVDGNPLHQPAGLNGWALIEDSTIVSQFLPFRDSSEISFFGFLGDIIIRDTNILNCISGIQIGADTGKGAWLANGTSVPWDDPILWRADVEGTPVPTGLYACKEVWIDNVIIEREGGISGNQRGGMQLSSAYAIHINRFNCVNFSGGGNWAIRIDNDMQSSTLPQNPGGVPMRRDPVTGLPAVYFYDAQSVLNHIDSIAVWDPLFGNNGDFRKLTYAELNLMTVGGLP